MSSIMTSERSKFQIVMFCFMGRPFLKEYKKFHSYLSLQGSFKPKIAITSLKLTDLKANKADNSTIGVELKSENLVF